MIELEEQGYVTIKIADVEQRLDLYHVHGMLREASKANQGNDDAYLQAVRDVVVSLGYPSCSLYLADKFALAVFKAVDDLKKKDNPTQESQDSMGSIPSL